MGAGKGKSRRIQSREIKKLPSSVGQRCVFYNEKLGDEYDYLDGKIGKVVGMRLEETQLLYKLSMDDGVVLHDVSEDEIDGKFLPLPNSTPPRFNVGDKAIFNYENNNFSWVPRNKESVISNELEIDVNKMEELNKQVVEIVEVTRKISGKANIFSETDVLYRAQAGDEYLSMWYLEEKSLASFVLREVKINTDELKF